MAKKIEVEVRFDCSVSLLYVKDWLDLLSQTRQTLAALPPSFVFSYGDGNKARIVDSEFKFHMLRRKRPLVLTVVQTPDVVCLQKKKKKRKRERMITDQKVVKIGNLAFIGHQKDAVTPVMEVLSVEDSPSEQCPVCSDTYRKPMKAKCGHVCCLHCWKSVLSRFLECPVCKSHVRLKTLRPS